MKENTIYILFSILRSVFHGNPMSEADKLLATDNSLSEVLELASKHDIAHLVAMGALNNGLANAVMESKLQELMFQAVYRYEKTNYELKQVSEAFEKAQIPFIPLKGSVLADYYPESWMRTSCDIDILVRQQDLDEAISCLIENLKYTEHERNTHDVSLFSPRDIHVELHFKLVGEGLSNDLKKPLSTIWDIAIPKKDWSYYYEMPDDMFYYYHMVHMAKHFEDGGCGIRPLIDLWILDNRPDVDKEKRERLLRRGKLDRFTVKAQKLSRVWLNGEDSNAITDKMQNYIISGGVYGTFQNRIAVKQQKEGGKIKYIFSRIFLPYQALKFEYPILQKRPWLTPVIHVCRWFKILFGGRAKYSIHELSYNNKISKSQADEMKTFLDEIGL